MRKDLYKLVKLLYIWVKFYSKIHSKMTEQKSLLWALNNALRVFQDKMTRPQYKSLVGLTRSIIRKSTTILSRLNEEWIVTKKYREKVSKHLGNIDIIEEVENKAIRCIQETIKKEWNEGENKKRMIISYDESDVFKPDAEKMPWLKNVRDWSTGLIGKGYIMRWVNVNGISLLAKLYQSNAWTKREETISIIDYVKSKIETTNADWVIDRGSDDIEIIDKLLETEKFVIRAKKNRLIIDKKTGKKMKVESFKDGTYNVELEWWTDVMLHIMKRKWFREPIRLYTNKEEETKVIITLYLRRWSIEEDFKKMKDLGLEEIRLFMRKKITNILAILQFIIILSQDLYNEVMERKDIITSGIYLYFKEFCRMKSLTLNPQSFLTYLSEKLPVYLSYDISSQKDYWLFWNSRQAKKLGLI